ncbi:hypothetical protein LTR56_001770 [Elasticomyces elasticus]|nr:hypothetical protein LTR56_001770 [Elasticomyces elasticus]
MSIVLYSLGIPGIITAFLLMPHFGRRTIFLWGQVLAAVTLLSVGALGVAQRSFPDNTSLSWGIGGLLLFLGFVDNCAVSPILFSLVSELPSSVLRSKSVVIARFSYAVANVAANVLTPFQLNPSAWSWGAISGFFWGGFCVIGLAFTYLRTSNAAPSPYFADNTSAAKTSSTGVSSPSVIADLISQDIYLCTTIDLIAASEGSATPSLVYFRESVESPFVTPYDAVNWQLFKGFVIEAAAHSLSLATATLAVQELHRARRNCLPQSKALSMYNNACEDFAIMMGSAGVNPDVILITAFMLSLFEVLVPQHVSQRPLGQSHGPLISMLEAWAYSDNSYTALSLRIGSWLLISHAAARRSGNHGLLAPELQDILVHACSRRLELPSLDAGPSATLADHVLTTLSSALFMFYFQLQLLSTKVADLSHYHRGRTTGYDQEEVSMLMSVLQKQIEALWVDRPALMRYSAGDMRTQFASDVAQPLVLMVALCKLTFLTELVEIGRNLSDTQRASTEAQTHMTKAREIISASDWYCGSGNVIQLACLRTLFLYAIESFDELDTNWAISKMRVIKDPICYSEFFASFAEGLTEEQRAKGRRVTTKWWCWRAFGITPPYL